MDNLNKKPTTINHLLDIEHQAGDSDSRTWKLVIYVVLLVLPAFLGIALLGVIPIKLMVMIYIVYAIRLTMLIPGKEKQRLVYFKQQLYDVYSSAENMMQYTIDDDGCIKYFNGEISYMLQAITGENTNNLSRSAMVKTIIEELSKDYTVDIRVYNDVNDYDLSRRYDGVKLFTNKRVADDFIELIDYNRKIITENSTMTTLIFVITGRQTYKQDMLKTIDRVINMAKGKIYKDLILLNTKEVHSILNRDIDTYIDFDTILRNKYSTKLYYGSKVVGYDVEISTKDKIIKTERGFIPSE